MAEWTKQKERRIADRKAEELRRKAKRKYDQGARELPSLQIGDVMQVQHAQKKTWDLIAEVVDIKLRGQSYLVKSETGKLYWRNRWFLKKYMPIEKSNTSGDMKKGIDTREEVPRQSPPPRHSGRERRRPVRYGCNWPFARKFPLGGMWRYVWSTWYVYGLRWTNQQLIVLIALSSSSPHVRSIIAHEENIK